MVPRKDLDRLLRQAGTHAISVIIGARQVGKSTLLDMIATRMDEPTETFNLENPLHLRIFDEGYTSFIRAVRTRCIFIDEFQYCRNISSIFKAAYDLAPTLKIYASGSSSMEIQTHLKESLAGRKLETILYPLSYPEWLLREGQDMRPRLSPDLEDFSSPTELEAHRACLEYFLRYGALPGLLSIIPDAHPGWSAQVPGLALPSADADMDAREYLHGIYQTYIAKDIKSFLKDESVLAFNKAISWLALHNGSQLVKSSLATVAGVSTRQIERFLDVLTGTFVLALLPPLANNRGKELTRMPKAYLYDQGVVNTIIQDFRPLQSRADADSIREQFVFWELKKHIDIRYSLHYWRTASGQEVDFVLRKDQALLPVEVKSGWKPPSIPSGLRSFLDLYPEVDTAVVLYDGPEYTLALGDRDARHQRILFLPLHRAWAVLQLL